MIKQIIFLIFTHFIADFALQSEWMAANKNKYLFILIAHSIIWTGCICFALEYFHIYSNWKLLFLLLGHILMDWLKGVYYIKYPFNDYEDMWPVYVDQFWHIIQCIIVGIF